METSETTTAPAETNTETTTTPVETQGGGVAAGASTATVTGPSPVEKSAALAGILAREKEDPNFDFKDEAEAALYQEYMDGKLKPGEVAAEGQDLAIPEYLKPIMAELGVKKPEELAEKIKAMKGAAPEAEKMSRLSKMVENTTALWEDARSGKPEALDFIEKNYGIRIQRGGAAQPASAASTTAPAAEKSIELNPELFIDEESAKQVNAALASMQKEYREELKGLKSVVAEFKDAEKTTRDKTAGIIAQNKVLDEMVNVAQRMETLKALPALREAIAAWYAGKPDERFLAFNDMFKIAKEEGCSLLAAEAIHKGRNADKLILEAEERGRKTAYNHKQNPSASGKTAGGAEERENYHGYNDEQLDAMAENHQLMPKDWFDSNDNPVRSKIGERAWKKLFA